MTTTTNNTHTTSMEGRTMDTKITDKIAALLAKAESTTPEEAEVLTAKAEELMVKYSIDQAMIDARRLGSTKAEEIITRKLFFNGSYEAGFVMMGHYVASGLGTVQTLVEKNAWDHETRKRGQKLWIVGFQSDVEQAELLITSLQLQSIVAMKKWWNGSSDRTWMNGSEGWRARRQFIISFGMGAGERISRAKQKAVQEATSADTGTALVLRDRQQMVRQAAASLSSGRSRGGIKGGSGSASSAGREAGRNANTGGSALGQRRGISS